MGSASERSDAFVFFERGYCLVPGVDAAPRTAGHSLSGLRLEFGGHEEKGR